MAFKIKVNGEVVKEMEFEGEQVTGVSLMTARGEAGSVGLSVGDDEVNVQLEVRFPDDSDYLDVISTRLEREKADAREKSAEKKVAEGRKLQEEMDKKRKEEEAAAIAAASGVPPAEAVPELVEAEVTAEPEKVTAATKKAT